LPYLKCLTFEPSSDMGSGVLLELGLLHDFMYDHLHLQDYEIIMNVMIINNNNNNNNVKYLVESVSELILAVELLTCIVI